MAVQARRKAAPPPPPPPPQISVRSDAAAAPVVVAPSPETLVQKSAQAVAPPAAEKPSYRALRVYAFDPSRGRRLGNYMTMRVKFEDLAKGLDGKQLHVIDYDASNGIYYKAVDLNSQAALVEGGLAPSESDPRFHQQMAYAVAMETISTFERALGRDIQFEFGDQNGFRTQLRIFPHAMYEPNAYYSRELGALVFGYFRASAEDAGTGLPGGTVFTVLSHDIIAHETTHAIVDTLRESFMEPTNPDVRAFHEAFADIVALFQHFKFEEVVRDTLQRSGGVLHQFDLSPRGAVSNNPDRKIFIIGEMPEGNPLLELARQFGESMGRRAALRGALGVPPDPQALANATEAHERGAVLVAAVFDAYFSSFMQRTADLIRLARAAAGGSDEIHPDIANRLAREAARAANSFSSMCIRALDYCPPVDITFGEFLRAIVTADTELYRSDDHEYRYAMIQAFRARGIVPDDVTSLAEESLIWQKAPEGAPACPGLCFDLDDPRKHFNQNCDTLEKVVRANPWYFGLCAVKKHDTAAACTCKVPDAPRAVRSVNMVMRGGSQRPQVEFVAHIVGHAPLDADDTKNRFKGGATVVYDATGNPKLVVYKRLSSQSRRKRQQDFITAAQDASPFTNYTDDDPMALQFASLHRGC